LISLKVDFETDTITGIKETSGSANASVNWPRRANNLKIADLVPRLMYPSINFGKMTSIQMIQSEYEKHYKRLPTHTCKIKDTMRMCIFKHRDKS